MMVNSETTKPTQKNGGQIHFQGKSAGYKKKLLDGQSLLALWAPLLHRIPGYSLKLDYSI